MGWFSDWRERRLRQQEENRFLDGLTNAHFRLTDDYYDDHYARFDKRWNEAVMAARAQQNHCRIIDPAQAEPVSEDELEAARQALEALCRNT